METLIIFIFLLALASGILFRRFTFSEKLKQRINEYLIYFGLPFFIFTSLVEKGEIRFLEYGLIIILFSLIIGIAFFLIIKLFNFSPQRKASLLVCSAYGNVAYLGIPIAYLFFQEVGLIIASVASLIHGLFHFSLGIFLPNIYLGSKKIAFSQVIKTPLIYSFSLALILSRFPISIPNFIETFAFSAIYLAVFVIGLSLVFKQFDKTFFPAFVLKFIGVPVIIFLILYFFPNFSFVEKCSFLLLAFTPPALTNTPLAIKFKWDSVFAANFTSFGTIFFLAIVFLIYFIINF